MKLAQYSAIGPMLLFAVVMSTSAAESGAPDSTRASRPLYSLPYAPGSEFIVGLGYNQPPTHVGQYAIDWLMPEGTPVLAAQGGVVVEAVDGFTQSGLTPDMFDKANRLVIRHDDGTFALYLHLAPGGLRVKLGQRVAEGETIALSGNTGYSATPHLHFMAYRKHGGVIESYPVWFKSDADEPFFIAPGAKYRAPGGSPKPEEGPLRGIRGTGQLSTIRPHLVELVKTAENPVQAAIRLKKHLLAHRAAYQKTYHAVFAQAKTGDKAAMKELQDFLDGMDLQADPHIARLLVDPAATATAYEAMALWWGLFAME